MSFKSMPESFNLVRMSGRISGLSIFLIGAYLPCDKNEDNVGKPLKDKFSDLSILNIG